MKTLLFMGLELSDKDRRFINVMILGIILLVVGFATIFTYLPEVYIPFIVGGLIAIVVGILNFQINRRKRGDLRKALHERIDRESEDDNERDELFTRANEWFSKKSSEEDAFTYLFTEAKNPPKKAICMISRTTFEEKEDGLQCPNCENYFQKKYLLEWLNKNTNCPICRTKLKIKKI